jgi:hypothetical protein
MVASTIRFELRPVILQLQYPSSLAPESQAVTFLIDAAKNENPSRSRLTLSRRRIIVSH